MKEDASLENETISLVFFEDAGLARSQQMFTDLNKHAVKTSNSLATLYDARDEIAVATKGIIEAIPFFRRFTDKERDILGKNSSNLFTLNMMYKANQKILHSDRCSADDERFLLSFWSLVADNVVEWQEVLDKTLTKKSRLGALTTSICFLFTRVKIWVKSRALSVRLIRKKSQSPVTPDLAVGFAPW